MYLSTGYNRVVALEPETGKKMWEYESAHAPAMRGVAYWPGDGKLPAQIIFGTADGWLISLNAKTGKPVPGFGEEGMVNLKLGVADKFPNRMYAMSSPPAIYKNLAITGSHLPESPSLGPSGDIRCVGHAHWETGMDLPHDSAAGRTESRCVERRSMG